MNNSINPISVVRRTCELYVCHVQLLLPASACLAVIIFVMQALAIGLLPLVLVALAGYLAATAFFTGVVVRIAASDDGEQERSISQIARDLRPAFAQLMLVIGTAGIAIGLLTSVASLLFAVVLLGAVLNTHASLGGIIAGATGISLVFVVPAALLMVRWSVAAPVAVLECPGGLSALGRSGKLVRGNRWQVLGTIVLLAILLLIVGGAIELAGNAAGSSAAFIAKALVTLLVGPVAPLAATALYFKLRSASPAASARA
jgi:hypothetical protein